MRRSAWVNLALLLAVAVLFVAPLAQYSGAGSEFGGTDARATEIVAEDNPGYRPWFAPVFQPPSASVESALFALQAAVGAGLLGYYFGVARTRKRLVPDRDEQATRDG